LGVELEPLAGFKINISHDFEKDQYSAGLNISFSHFCLGFDYTKKDDVSDGLIYSNISKKKFQNFLDKTRKNKFYNYKLSGAVLDQKPINRFGPIEIVSTKGKTVEEILATIKKLKNNDEIMGIVFKSGNIITNMATFQEIHDVLLDFKTSGKKIIYYFDFINNMNYALAASVGDKIYLNPAGSLFLNGMTISNPYLKNLFDTLGIDVINFRSHDYKTAGNMFSESDMTDAERKMYNLLLDDLYEDMINMIAEGRNLSREKVRQLIDSGPYFIAENALDADLIDGIIYKDELEDKIKKKFGKIKIVKNYAQNTFRNNWSDKHKSQIAIIYATGPIHTGKGQPGKTIGSKTLSKAIKDARESKSIKGIILRVNSGGGSALASDIITRQVEKCKTGENAKPFVVSMSGAAASGGYHISCMADAIIAEPETITGSIGVIGIVPNFTRLYKKILINWDTVKRGTHADLFSTSRPMTETEKNIMQKSIAHTYWDFVKTVSQGRDIEKDEIHKIAKGQVWTGKTAKKLRLVDKLGGLNLVVKTMKQLCNIEPDKEIELVKFPRSSPALFTINIGTDFMTTSRKNIPAEFLKISDMVQQWKLYGDEKILYLFPYNFWDDIK